MLQDQFELIFQSTLSKSRQVKKKNVFSQDDFSSFIYLGVHRKAKKMLFILFFFRCHQLMNSSWIECLPLPSWREENSVVDRSVFWVKKLKCYSVKNEKWKPGDHIFPYKFLLLSFENKLSRAHGAPVILF